MSEKSVNLELARLILESLPLHGDKPNKSLVLQMHRMFIGETPNRELWRKQPFDMKENLAINLLYEISAYCYCEDSWQNRLNKIAAAISADTQVNGGTSACLVGLIASAERLNTAYSSAEEENIKITISLMFIALLVSLLIYTQLESPEITDSTFMVPVLTMGYMTFMSIDPYAVKDNPHPDLLHRLSALELATMIGVLSIKGLTDINQFQFADMLAPDRLLIGAGFKYSWMLLFMIIDSAIDKHVRQCRKLTDCIKFMHNAGEMGKTFAAMVMQPLFKGIPDTPCAADTITDAMGQRKYLMWKGLTQINWQENNMKQLYLHYKNDKSIILSMIQADFKNFDSKINDVLNVHILPPNIKMQCSVFLPPLAEPDGWRAIRRKYVVEEKILSDGAVNECGVAAEAIRMCLVPKEHKIQNKRTPSGYVKADRVPRKDDIAVTYIPRIEYAKQQTNEEPSERAEQERHYGKAPRAAYMVAGFIRQIPEAWKTSEAAKERAKDAGFDELPIGYTYVRPHVRGTGNLKDVKVVKVKR